MFASEKYRTYLLGMADADLESSIEEGILSGQVDPRELQQIEEELIDDQLFGRLSREEERSFRDGYLSTAEGIRKLAFAQALQRYAAMRRPGEKRRSGLVRLYEALAARRDWALAAAFSCAALAALWLGDRDLRLHHQLTQAARTNDEQQRVIASMQERGAALSSESPAEAAVLPAILRLSPGVQRGLATVPVLHLRGGANSATIIPELPFDAGNRLTEELLNSENQSIWSQQFSIRGGEANDGTATVVLPASILPTGDYRLRVTSGGPGAGEATYLFRVHRD